MKVVESYSKIAKDLQESYPKLSEYQRLSLGIQIQRNQILKAGLVVHSYDKHPSGIEAIAIALGYGTGSR